LLVIRPKADVGQPRPLHGALALFDPLLASAALIVEAEDTFGWAWQVGDDKADAGIKLARMPFDFCRHAARNFFNKTER